MLRVGEICYFLKTEAIETVPHLTKCIKVILYAEPCGRWLGYRDQTKFSSSKGSVYLLGKIEVEIWRVGKE